MTRQELSAELQTWFCGCGQPEDACAALFRLLSLHPLYENRKAFESWIGDDGIQMLLLYLITHLDWAEHGGSVGGGWLTDKGKAILEALEREKDDNFEALCEQRCMHGYSVDDHAELKQCPECGPMNP